MLNTFDIINNIKDKKGFVKFALIDPDRKNDKIIQSYQENECWTSYMELT